MSGQLATQNFGAAFIQCSKHYDLKVPSAITPGEHNLLLNPLHPLHAKTKIIDILDPFVFDKRLLQFAKPQPLLLYKPFCYFSAAYTYVDEIHPFGKT